MPLVRGPTPCLSKQTKFLLLLVVGLWVRHEAPWTQPQLSVLDEGNDAYLLDCCEN